MVERLLAAGADIDVSNRWGRTPLHVAARRGCARVARLLLDAGADPNAVTAEGWTPLHVAARSGHRELMDLLESNGADGTRVDSNGKTADAVWRPRPPEIAIDPARAEEYEGIYELGGGFELKVWLEGGKLHVREVAPDSLYAIGVDSFSCRREPWLLTFRRDSDDNVTSVDIAFLRRTVRGTRTLSPRYIGARACLDCHGEPAHASQYVAWLQSRHAHAYWRLAADWALVLARQRPHYQDLERPTEDSRCLLCHVTGRQDDDALFAVSFRSQEGIGCESCHGPGSEYATMENMAAHQSYLDHGGRVPDTATCRGCHRRGAFDFAAMWAAGGHPVVSSEAAPQDGH
jgi:hypothetical protein